MAIEKRAKTYLWCLYSVEVVATGVQEKNAIKNKQSGLTEIDIDGAK